MKIHVYNDCGHGWASVKRSLLVELGIADKVSPYSFQRGQSVYLEEDCDLSLLVSAFKARDIAPEWIEHYTDRRSPIRSYESYRFSA
jgi:hypothetical protein